MVVRIDLPGADSYPTFRERCLACGYEFDVVGTCDDSDKAVCPECHSGEVKELYMSFPEDGPGYQKDYGTQSDRLRGGNCGSSCGSDFELGVSA